MGKLEVLTVNHIGLQNFVVNSHLTKDTEQKKHVYSLLLAVRTIHTIGASFYLAGTELAE
jgi:hypothetical protein